MPTMNPSDDPAAHTGNTSTNDDPQAAAATTTNEADPSSNEFQNLFHENDTSMQLDPRGEGIIWNGDSIPANEVGVFNRNYEVDLGEEQYGVPPLPPPVDDAAEAVVVIPNNIEQQQQGEPQREEVVVVEGEIIGPQLQQQAVEEEEGVPVETVQLWEEVAFGLEKNQT
eukprot:scaffold16561_cov77-Skeletonema_dohrnii-CCMP3373.AAC.1